MPSTYWVKDPTKLQTMEGTPISAYYQAASLEDAEEKAKLSGEAAEIVAFIDPDEAHISDVRDAPTPAMEETMAELEGRLNRAGLTDAQMIDEIASLWNTANDIMDSGNDAEPVWQRLIDRLLGGRGTGDEVIEPTLPKLLQLAVKGTQ